MISKPTKWIKKHVVNTKPAKQLCPIGFHQKNNWLFSTPTECVLLALTILEKKLAIRQAPAQ